MRNLVVIELTKVTNIHLAFSCICNGSEAIKLRIRRIELLNRLYNIGKLSNARRLDYNSIGFVLHENLLESLSEITDKRTTDTTGIHLRNFDSGILKESAVNTYFTKFVLYKNYLFVIVRFFYKLLYKCRFTGTEKSRKYINFSHKITSHNIYL